MTTSVLRATDQIADLQGGAGRAAGRREGSTASAERKPLAREGPFAQKLRKNLKRTGEGAAAEKPAAEGRKAGRAEERVLAEKASARGNAKASGAGERAEAAEAEAAWVVNTDGADTTQAEAAPGEPDAAEPGAAGEAKAARASAAEASVEGAAPDAERSESDRSLGAAEGEAVAEAQGEGGAEGLAGDVVKAATQGGAAGLPITIAVVNRQLVQADPRLLARGLGAVRIATAASGETQRRAGVGGTVDAASEGEALAWGAGASPDKVSSRGFGQPQQDAVQGSAHGAEGAGAGEAFDREARARGERGGVNPDAREAAPVADAQRTQGTQAETRLVSERVVSSGGGGVLRAEVEGGGGEAKGAAAPIEGWSGSAGGRAGLRLRAEVQPSGRAGQGPPDFTSVEAQVSRGMAAVLAQRGGTVALRLQPAALGELRVQLDWEKGSVSVRFVAASEKARGLLEQSLPGLRASLEARGLEVVRVAVESPGAQAADAAKHAASGPEQALVAQDHAGGGQGGDRPWSEQGAAARSAGNERIDALGPEAGAASMVEGLGPATVWAEPGGDARLVRLRVDALA